MDEQWGSGCVQPALHSPPTDPFSIPWREILLGKTMLSEEMVGRKKLSTASTPLLRHLLRQQHFLNKKPQQATTTCLCISCVVFQSLTGVTKTLTRKEKKKKRTTLCCGHPLCYWMTIVQTGQLQATGFIFYPAFQSRGIPKTSCIIQGIGDVCFQPSQYCKILLVSVI